jgi:uncharacterized protein YecT (DUF1311 family)
VPPTAQTLPTSTFPGIWQRQTKREGEKKMKRVKLALVAMAGIFCFACKSKTDVDFSIVPVRGSNGEYQYIDVSKKGKIAINPQFSEAHIFRDGLALVKTSGRDGKWGYIDKNGKFAITPVYSVAQDFGDGVAWVQMEDQPPMLIDKKGKMLLQVDSLITAYPFNDGIAVAKVFSNGQEGGIFINKKGEPAVTTTVKDEMIRLAITDDIYAFGNVKTGKWGYKNKKGDIIVNEQFDLAMPFYDGVAVVMSSGKYGTINKKGEYVINPQYDLLSYDSDGLFYATAGKKSGWVNKKGEIIINPQFDDLYPFLGAKLAAVRVGDRWAYVDRKGQIIINPQFTVALPFYGDYALVGNEDEIGFINKKGEFVVSPLYGVGLTVNDASRYFSEYVYAIIQNVLDFPVQYNDEYQKGDFLAYPKLREKQKAYIEGKKEKAEQIGKEDLSATKPIKPSFNCAKAGTLVEKAICSDAELAELDRDMAEDYKCLLKLEGDDLKAEQKEWLKKRDKCNSDVNCLKSSYREREQEFRNNFCGTIYWECGFGPGKRC